MVRVGGGYMLADDFLKNYSEQILGSPEKRSQVSLIPGAGQNKIMTVEQFKEYMIKGSSKVPSSSGVRMA